MDQPDAGDGLQAFGEAPGVVVVLGQALDVVIEAAFANADAMTGDYAVSVPAGAAKVAPLGAPLATAVNGGKYVVRATDGATTQDSALVDVSTADATGVDFVFP